MHIDINFFSKVISKYLVEFLLTLTSIRILSHVVRSKLYLIILYCYHNLGLPFFLQLNGRISNHIFFNTLHQLKIKTFLKYVLNKHYREDISIVSENLYSTLLKNSSENLINTMLFSRKKAFVGVLLKFIQNMRIEHGDFVRDQATEGKISPKFAWDYFLYMDFVMQFLVSRIKDLQNDDQNNYELYLKFLFIMNDWLLIYMEQIPGISRARFKGTSFQKKA